MAEEVKQTRMQKRQAEEQQAGKRPLVEVNVGGWLLRIVIVVVLIVIAAISGAMIGYGGIGNGNPMQVLNPSTWKHIFDIMNGKM